MVVWQQAGGWQVGGFNISTASELQLMYHLNGWNQPDQIVHQGGDTARNWLRDHLGRMEIQKWHRRP